MTESDGISRRQLLLVAGSAFIAGGVQTFRIGDGEGGVLAMISLLAFFSVFVVSALQLYRISRSC